MSKTSGRLGGQTRTQREAIAAERRVKAHQLKKAGCSYRQIGQQLGCTAATALADVRRVLRQLATEERHEAEEWRALELERLDDLLLGIWRAATGGDLQAIDRALKIAERRSKLLGLDAAQQVEHEHRGTINVRELSDEQLDALIAGEPLPPAAS